MPPGFVGVSLEYSALHLYTGRDPNAINPVLVQLLRNLAPGQSPVLRIGGNSSDYDLVADAGHDPARRASATR